MVYDTIIIGAGAMGSSTAYWLSKYQDSVMLIDQYPLLHHKGSSHGMSRVIRRTYREKHFAEMMGEAYDLWNKVQEETGVSVYAKTGGLNIGPDKDANLRSTLRTCEEEGFDHEVLNVQQINERFPAFKTDPDYMAIYQEDTGILNASKAVDMFQTQASHQGAMVRGDMKVSSIKSVPNGVLVSCGDKSYEAKKAVVTAGPWLNRVLKPLDLQLDVTIWKLTFAYWKTLNSDIYQQDKFPVFIHWDHEINYGFPIHERKDFVKIAPHITETIPKVKEYDGENEPNQELLKDLTQFIETRFNEISAEPEFVETCLYTMTQNEGFILDHLPSDPNVILGAGFSGHGFKFTPLIGKILGEMVLGNESGYEMNHFEIGKFIE